MKHQVLKKAFLASVLSMLGFGSWAQMSHNTLFFGFSPAGSINVLDKYFEVEAKYKIIDGFTFSAYFDYNSRGKKDEFSFIDLRLNYLHGKKSWEEFDGDNYGDDFRQAYVQINYGYIINNKHRVQLPLYLGLALGYDWVQPKGVVFAGMGAGAKLHVYITDQWGVFAGGHVLWAYGEGVNSYLDFGLSYSFFK